jgi:hypothetical protein
LIILVEDRPTNWVAPWTRTNQAGRVWVYSALSHTDLGIALPSLGQRALSATAKTLVRRGG